MKNWIFLGAAILLEVIASTALKRSEGFTKALPGAVSAISYVGCFYFLSLSLRSIPLGIAYAIWAGAGIVILALIGHYFLKQPLDLAAGIGIALILAGVVVINAFSKSSGH